VVATGKEQPFNKNVRSKSVIGRRQDLSESPHYLATWNFDQLLRNRVFDAIKKKPRLLLP
jgi:hypothetical protein